MRPLLSFLCLPNVVIGWLFSAVVRALWGKSLTWHGPVLVVVLREDSWPIKTWWKGWAGFSIGHGVMLAPGQEPVLPHELEHTEQAQAASVAGFAAGALASMAGSPVLGAVLWTLMPLLSYGGGSAVAWLNGKRGYRDNLFERAARDASGV